MSKPKAQADETRRELLALVLASLACVTVLLVNFTEAAAPTVTTPFGPAGFLAAAVLGGLVIAGCVVAFLVMQRMRRQLVSANEDSARLRRDLVMAEAVFHAEPQVLVFWENDSGLRVVTHTLSTVTGVPSTNSEMLRFGLWLEPESAEALKTALDRLFETGEAFNVFLKTKQGGHLDADGRAAGSRAIVRFRDVAGYKQDLVSIIEKQRQLQRDVEISRTLLNALPMPAWLRDGEGQLIWVNNAYAKAVEAASAEEAAVQQIELLEARQRQKLVSMANGDRVHREQFPLVVEGRRKTHDVLTIPADGASAGVAIDVAELETARGELDQQMSAFDRTLDRVSTAVAIFNHAQQLTFYNDAYGKLWELDPNWLDQGPTDTQILDRLRELSRLPSISDYRAWKQEHLACYSTKEEFEDLWHLPDGRLLSVVAERRPDGGVTYLYEDKSEQLALESRFRTLIQVQSETLESLTEGVAVFGTDARLRLFNPAFAQVWRLSMPQLAQRPRIEEIIAQVGDRLKPGSTEWNRITESVTALSGEYKTISGTMECEDGAFIEFAAVPLPDGGTLVTFSDVTAMREYQRALVERNEALVAADRLKDNFISHVSYELRTPLTDIIGFSEFLESPRVGELNPTQREYLNAVSASSRQLRSVIDNILDLASIDAGSLDLEIGRIDVNDLISSAIDGIRDRAARAQVTIDVGVTDDFEAFEGDPQRMRQVLFNLASNAIGFSPPKGTVYVSAWTDGDDAVFEVKDQGKGIPVDEQERIFDRFVTHSRGAKHRGAGLGLSIVRSFVELHGGTVTLESEPGHGTKVAVRVPRIAQPKSRPAAPERDTVLEQKAAS
jgi:signal transduction histidine kinase